MSHPTATRLTQGTALFLSSFTSGVSVALSTFLVPRLLESPTEVMLAQWAHTYALGAATMPAAAAAASAAYIWLGFTAAAKAPRGFAVARRGPWYLAAAALTLGIVPYTVLVMRGTNGRLKEMGAMAQSRGQRKAGAGAAGLKAEGEGEGEEKKALVASAEEVAAEQERSAKALVDWWGVLNLGRSALLVAGAVCGLVATL